MPIWSTDGSSPTPAPALQLERHLARLGRSLAFMQPGSGRSLRSLGASTWPSPSSSIPFEHWFVEPPPPPAPGAGRPPPGVRGRRSRAARAEAEPVEQRLRERLAARARGDRRPERPQVAAASPPAAAASTAAPRRLLHAARGAPPIFSPRTLPLTFSVTVPPATTPRRCTTATPSRPFFAAPVTAIPAGAFALTFAFFADRGDGDRRPGPRAGTGTLTVAAWAVAAASRTSRSVMGRRSRGMAATVRSARSAAASGKSLVGFRPRAQVDILVV